MNGSLPLLQHIGSLGARISVHVDHPLRQQALNQQALVVLFETGDGITAHKSEYTLIACVCAYASCVVSCDVMCFCCVMVLCVMCDLCCCHVLSCASVVSVDVVMCCCHVSITPFLPFHNHSAFQTIVP